MKAPTTVTAREMLRRYKEVFERVKQTGQPTLVLSHKQPQVAIVSLEDFAQLEELHYLKSAKALLEVAKKTREVLKGEKLPTDLSEKHDEYLWQAR